MGLYMVVLTLLSVIGWYYSANVNIDALALRRFVFATLDKTTVDEEIYYRYELSSYILGKE